MANLLGALRFALGADTAAFERDLKGAESALKRVAVVGTALGTVVGNALVGAFNSLAQGVKRAIDEADKMDEVSQSVGLTTEKLSALKFAAQQSGVSFETFTRSAVLLSRNMAAAASDSSSQAGRAFAAVGVSVTDAAGQLRPMQEVLLDIAAKFATYKDGAEKVALATALFGRAGADMIPFLNQGRTGIQQLTDEAARLGIVLSTETGQRAGQFNDTMSKIKTVFDAIVVQIAAKLLPILQNVADKFTALAVEGGKVDFAMRAIDAIIRTIVGAMTVLGAIVESTTITLATLLNALILIAKFDISGAKEALATGFRGVKESIAEASAEIQKLLGGLNAIAPTAAAAGANVPTATAPIIASARAASDAMREWRDNQRAVLDDMLAGAAPYIEKIEAINKALAQRVINERTQGQLLRRVEQENRSAITSTATLLGSTLTTVFAKSKAAAVAQAIISTAVGISNALAGPPTGPPWPFNIAQAALVAASGAAQIAAIRSTNSSGGGGAAPSVRGGGGGESSQPATQLQSQTLTVQGIEPGAIFTGDAVRALSERLLEFQRNGGKVVLA